MLKRIPASQLVTRFLRLWTRSSCQSFTSLRTAKAASTARGLSISSIVNRAQGDSSFAWPHWK